MIEMTMAHDQRVDFRGVDLQHDDVAVDGFGRPAVIQQKGTLGIAALRLQEQRQSPFAVQRALAIRRAAGLGLDAIRFLRLEEDIAGAVDQNADTELVDHRHLDRPRLGHLDAGKSAGRRGGGEAGRHLQGIASIETRHGAFSWARSGSQRRFVILQEIQGRLPGLSTEMAGTCRRLCDGYAGHSHSDMTWSMPLERTRARVRPGREPINSEWVDGPTQVGHCGTCEKYQNRKCSFDVKVMLCPRSGGFEAACIIPKVFLPRSNGASQP
jgi:hypothetical protein